MNRAYTGPLGTFLMLTLSSCSGDAAYEGEALPVLTAATDHLEASRLAARFDGRVPVFTGEHQPTDTLRLLRVHGDSTDFGQITSIHAFGDRLLVTDRLMHPHIVVLDRNTGTILRRFGANGGGPGEFRDPTWVFIDSMDPPRAWVWDDHNRRLTLLDLLAAGADLIAEQIRINPAQPVLGMVWSGDNLIANGFFGEHAFLILDREGQTVTGIATDHPFTERDVPVSMGRRFLNRTYMAVGPVHRRLVLAYQFKNRLDFYTANGEPYGTITGPRAATARFHVRGDRFFWDPANEMTYQGLAATDCYVYASFNGTRLEESAPGDLIQVFRWDGAFVGEFATDRPLFRFNVSQDDTVLFGAFEDPYPRVGEWPLPHWLRSLRAPSMAEYATGDHPCGTGDHHLGGSS
jgi:hypothetical protein